jgi:hypothetical protein
VGGDGAPKTNIASLALLHQEPTLRTCHDRPLPRSGAGARATGTRHPVDGWLRAILSDNSFLDYAQKVYGLAQVRSQRPENRRRREWCGWWRWTLGSRRACPR